MDRPSPLREWTGSPNPRRRRAAALAASLAAHALLLAALLADRGSGVSPLFLFTRPVVTPVVVVDLPPVPPAVPRAVPDHPAKPAPAGPRVPTHRSSAVAARAHSAPVAADTVTAHRTPPSAPGVATPAAPLAAGSPSAGDGSSGGVPLIGPSLADAKLWARPLPLPPAELAKRLRHTDKELAESLVTATVQAYLDSMAREPGAEEAQLPSWTTKIAGKEFGIDGRNITIAGLKIPAAVLALLPIHVGVNYEQYKANQRLMEMRTDLMQAAQRADNLEEFKQRIKEIRERKEQEEQFQKNQRTPPPASPPDTTPRMAAP